MNATRWCLSEDSDSNTGKQKYVNDLIHYTNAPIIWWKPYTWKNQISCRSDDEYQTMNITDGDEKILNFGW